MANTRARQETRWEHRGGRYRVVAKLSTFLQRKRREETDHTTIFPEGFFDPIFQGYKEPKLVRWRKLVNRDEDYPVFLRARPRRVDYRNPLALLNVSRSPGMPIAPQRAPGMLPPGLPPESDASLADASTGEHVVADELYSAGEFDLEDSLGRAELARMELAHLPSLPPMDESSSVSLFGGDDGRAGVETLARKIEELEALGHELPGAKRTIRGRGELPDAAPAPPRMAGTEGSARDLPTLGVESVDSEPKTGTNYALDDLDSALDRAIYGTRSMPDLRRTWDSKRATVWPAAGTTEPEERPIDRELEARLESSTDLAAGLPIEKLMSEPSIAAFDSSEPTPGRFRLDSDFPSSEGTGSSRDSAILIVRSAELEAIDAESEYLLLVDDEDDAPQTQRDLASGGLMDALQALLSTPERDEPSRPSRPEPAPPLLIPAAEVDVAPVATSTADDPDSDPELIVDHEEDDAPDPTQTQPAEFVGVRKVAPQPAAGMGRATLRAGPPAMPVMVQVPKSVGGVRAVDTEAGASPGVAGTAPRGTESGAPSASSRPPAHRETSAERRRKAGARPAKETLRDARVPTLLTPAIQTLQDYRVPSPAAVRAGKKTVKDLRVPPPEDVPKDEGAATASRESSPPARQRTFGRPVRRASAAPTVEEARAEMASRSQELELDDSDSGELRFDDQSSPG